MKKAGPWSIDGIKPDIREAAREAARRQGLSLSAWLNDIIITQAAELGIDADEMDSDDRLEAVAARLHQLGDREERDNSSTRARNARAPRDERWQERGYGRLEPRPEPAPERMRGHDAEALLDAAVDAFELSIAKSQRQTAQSFEAVSRRLADIETHLTQRPQDDATRPIKSALARLEARLDTFTQPPPPQPPMRDDAGLKRLESKLDALLRGSALSPVDTHRPLSRAGWRDSLESAVAEIGRTQHLLNGEPTGRKASAARAASPVGRHTAAAPPSADLQLLQRDIAALGAKLEEMRLQDLSKDLTRLRSDIGTMSAGMADLAPRDSVTAIESAIRNLTTRIETSREDGMRETLLQPITELVDGLRHSLGTIDPNPSIDGLGREIRSISDKLETLAGQPHEPPMLARVQAQIQDIHGLLTAAATHPLPLEQIERKVASLAEQIDRQRSLGPMPSDEDFAAAGLRQAQSESLVKIEDRLDDLSQKIEKVLAGRTAPSSKMDAESLEAVVKVLADKFIAAQDPRAGQAAFESLQAQIAQLAQRLEQTDTGFSALTGLQRSVGELFTHLDETRFAAHEVAHTAARNAAQEAVREVIEQKELIPGIVPEDPGITREIADLRAVQDEAGRRTHSTLNAVHETLEKIVDRLAMLEEEIGEAKEVSVQEQRLAEQNAIFARYRDNEMAVSQSAPVQPGVDPKGREPRLTDDKIQVRPVPNPSADFLIEPGTLFPHSNGGTGGAKGSDGSSPDPARSRADFIAAARRAAQAAQADHEIERPRVPITGLKDTNTSAGLIAQARDFLTNHKRQLTLSIAALFLAVGAYAVIKTVGSSAVDVSANALNSVIHNMADTRADHKAMTRAPANDIALNQQPQQMPRAAVPGQQSSDAGPRPPAPSPRSEAMPSSLPLMVSGGGSAPQRPIAGSDPIVTGSVLAPKPTNAPEMESPAAAAALREQAEAGNAVAQYELATRYAEGRLLVRDFKLAADWYEKAAARGLGPAQYRLGSLYEKGIGVGRDLTRAREWYEKAANQGHSHAMHNLAVLIAEGGDGKPDYQTAAIWFRKAAELGIRDSQYNLAILYARGLGVQQDLVQSYKWFAIAAAQGDEDAGKKREDVAAKLDAKALAEAKAAVDTFQPREADHAANEVQMPPGGWEAVAPPQLAPKNLKPKISRL